MLCGVFKKTGVEIVKQNVQACHYLKEIQITIVKFVNRTDCLQILRIKKELKSLDPTMLEFPDMTKSLLMKVYVLITEASGINPKN